MYKHDLKAEFRNLINNYSFEFLDESTAKAFKRDLQQLFEYFGLKGFDFDIVVDYKIGNLKIEPKTKFDKEMMFRFLL